MKSSLKIGMFLGFAVIAVSCHDKEHPNYQYFPNMYESVAYETYSESGAFGNGKEGQIPVAGTIKRGSVPYEYPNTTEGYNMAKANSVSPLDSVDVDMAQAGQLFGVYCAICHGEKGDGKGNLSKREKLFGIPNYKDRMITEGSIFHVETYGLNSMGSYANQLSAKERWMVAKYVLKLRSEL